MKEKCSTEEAEEEKSLESRSLSGLHDNMRDSEKGCWEGKQIGEVVRTSVLFICPL